MIRRLAIGMLLMLAACNRQATADVTLDADAAQRNATAAKTLADLAAADAASRGPAPVIRDALPKPSAEADAPARVVPAPQPTEDSLPSEEDQSVALSNNS